MLENKDNKKYGGYRPNRSHRDVSRGYQNGERELSPENDSEVSENMIAGRNAVKELLAGGRDIDKIYTAKGDRDGSIVVLVAEATARHIPVIEVERSKLDDMTHGMRHQGIVAMAAERNYETVDDMMALAESRGEEPFILICDGIEDPHNLGAIIRSAECAGAHGIIIPKRRAVGLTATVAKASAGAIEHMPICKVSNLSTAVEDLKERGFWIYAADMGGKAYYETDFGGKVALVMGSEGFGIQRLLKENCDFTVSIPLYGKVNSMNVSAAAAVLLCEVARRKHQNP